VSRASPLVRGSPDDLRRLNALLAPNLTFLAVVARAGGRLSAGRVAAEAGVLIERLPAGERRATAPLWPSSSRRARMHALSAALAECAMVLGLGTSACRAGALERRQRSTGP
jgi:hypothetical protein